MPAKKTLETYGDLLKFAEGLNKEIVRLGGVPLSYYDSRALKEPLALQQKKADILCVIMEALKDEYDVYGQMPGVHIYPPLVESKRANGYLVYAEKVQLTDDLNPPFDYPSFISKIENKIAGSAYNSEKIPATEYINQTLGTHQNWFKWLLSCIFDAPKSKQFIDGYSIFETKQSDQDDSVLDSTYDDESPHLL